MKNCDFFLFLPKNNLRNVFTSRIFIYFLFSFKLISDFGENINKFVLIMNKKYFVFCSFVSSEIKSVLKL